MIYIALLFWGWGLLYAVGVIIFYAIKGGEIEGIGDIAFIFFWPITLIIYGIMLIVAGIYTITTTIKNLFIS